MLNEAGVKASAVQAGVFDWYVLPRKKCARKKMSTLFEQSLHTVVKVRISRYDYDCIDIVT